MEILHKADLPQGGFAGLREHRLVMDDKVFNGRGDQGTWSGLGNFIYLADAQFNPLGETSMHSHQEIDVISVMVDGRVSHQGSLEHGQSLQTGQAQVQRAGGEGFSHNEINPDHSKNRMIQLWVLPEKAGSRAGYKLYTLPENGVTRIYGGSSDQHQTFASDTQMEVGYLKASEQLNIQQKFMLYFTQGSARCHGQTVGDGDLLRGDNLTLEIEEDAMVIIIKKEQAK